jgi:cell division protein FtsI/penicillin-binding protein 2
VIDCILRYADEATALAALDIAEDRIDSEWLADHVMPVTVRRISTGLPIAGYFLWISVTIEQAQKWQRLRDLPALQLVINRAKLNAREPGAIIKSTVGAAVLQDIMIEPVYMGCDFPFGGWTS